MYKVCMKGHKLPKISFGAEVEGYPSQLRDIPLFQNKKIKDRVIPVTGHGGQTAMRRLGSHIF
jgi:hypothetical protein